MLAAATLLEYLGEDVAREALRETPRRFVDALRELGGGLRGDELMPTLTTFERDSDELVIVRGIEFSSLCEHHLLPFSGIATIGYIPRGRIIGLSKLPRLIRWFARQLSTQELLTHRVAGKLYDHLRPIGCGVILRAHHSCMSCRGIRSSGEMITSAMLGAMRERHEARAELLALS